MLQMSPSLLLVNIQPDPTLRIVDTPPTQCPTSPEHSPLSTQRSGKPMESRSTLASLPPELILDIARHLPARSLIALKLCNAALLHKTPIPPDFDFNTRSVCEKKLIRRYKNEYKESRDGRRYCLICHTLQESKFLGHGGGKICSSHGLMFVQHQSTELDTDLQTRIAWTAQSRPDLGVFFIAVPRTLCAHTRAIIWDRQYFPCICGCGFCEHLQVTCYVRVANGLRRMQGESYAPSANGPRAGYDGNPDDALCTPSNGIPVLHLDHEERRLGCATIRRQHTSDSRRGFLDRSDRDID